MRSTAESLLISEIFPPVHGGSGRWFWELYSRLPREDYYIAAGNTPGAARFDKTHDMNVQRLNLSSKSWGVRSLIGLKFYFRTFLHIRRIIKTHKIKSIHCGRCLPEGLIGCLFKVIYCIPYLCFIHGEDVESAATSRELSWIVRKVLKNA